MLSIQMHPDWYRLEKAIPFNQKLKAEKWQAEILIQHFRDNIQGCKITQKQRDELYPLLGNLLHCYGKGVNLEYPVTRSTKSRRTLRDKLVRCQLITFHPGACFGTSAYYTSKMKPLPLLNDLFNPLIRITTTDLKTGKRSPIRGEDPDMTDRLYRYNNAMADHAVTDGYGNQLATSLYRCHKIINGHEFKGRFQQPSYQRLPEVGRDLIKINGQPIVRIDVSGSHPQVLYHQISLQIPTAAPYGIFPQHPQLKPISKLAMLMMINARCRQGAITALRNKISEKLPEFTPSLSCMNQHGIKFSHIFDGLEKLNAPISKHFYTQPCHRLMETEADVIFQTCEFLTMCRDIPALQVFDEIIVPAAEWELTKKALETVWKKHLGFTPRLTVKNLK